MGRDELRKGFPGTGTQNYLLRRDDCCIDPGRRGCVVSDKRTMCTERWTRTSIRSLTLLLADAAVTQSTAASLARRVKIIKRMQYLRPRPIPAIRRDVRGPEHGMEWPNHVLAASTRRLCHLRLDGFDHEGMLLDAYWIASDKFSKESGSLESAEA